MLGYAHGGEVNIPAAGGATGRLRVSRDINTRDSMRRSILSDEGRFQHSSHKNTIYNSEETSLE